MARTTDKPASTGDERRQKLWRELALVAIAPLLLYLLASLYSYSTDDPGWSRTGSVAGAMQNIGGLVGAYAADLAFWLFGYAAYSLPVVLGGIAWIALFGMDSDGDGRVDFGPALRLVGIVGFLVSATGLLQVLGGNVPHLPAELLALSGEDALALVQEAVDLAAERGATVVGLGGFSSIVAGGGLSVRAPAGMRVTSGNSLTTCAQAVCVPVNVDAAISVLLTATPAAGFAVGDWSGDCTGAAGAASTSLVMNAAKVAVQV